MYVYKHKYIHFAVHCFGWENILGIGTNSPAFKKLHLLANFMTRRQLKHVAKHHQGTHLSGFEISTWDVFCSTEREEAGRKNKIWWSGWGSGGAVRVDRIALMRWVTAAYNLSLRVCFLVEVLIVLLKKWCLEKIVFVVVVALVVVVIVIVKVAVAVVAAAVIVVVVIVLML